MACQANSEQGLTPLEAQGKPGWGQGALSTDCRAAGARTNYVIARLSWPSRSLFWI